MMSRPHVLTPHDAETIAEGRGAIDLSFELLVRESLPYD